MLVANTHYYRYDTAFNSLNCHLLIQYQLMPTTNEDATLGSLGQNVSSLLLYCYFVESRRPWAPLYGAYSGGDHVSSTDSSSNLYTSRSNGLQSSFIS